MRFARDSYAVWAELERGSGEQLVYKTGGLDLYPAGAHDWIDSYRSALDECEIPYEWLEPVEVMSRWPQWRLPDDVRSMYQEDAGIVAAARANASHRRLAGSLGATLVPNARVERVSRIGGAYELSTGDAVYRAERVILAADAWTNELLGQLWRPINLIVTQEQVTYYDSRDLAAFTPERFPIWIWMGEPSFYGLPAFGESGAKIGRDVGGPEVTGDRRSFEPRADYSEHLDGFMRTHLPGGFGPYLKQKTCLYTMTPDREFVLDKVPGHDRAVIGLGAAHGFKFASIIGKSLVEMVFGDETKADVSAWGLDREVLTMDDPPRALVM